MLSPNELLGQKVWLQVSLDSQIPGSETQPVKAEITQPTSPPWFYARYIDPPRFISASGQWLSLYEAQEAVLLNPVFEEEDYEDECYDDDVCEDELRYY